MRPTTTALPSTEVLTAEFLLEHFGPGADIDPVLTSEQAEQAERIAKGNATGRYTKQGNRASTALNYLCEVMCYHTVEVLRTPGYHGYWGNAKYAYLNSGHSTSLELYYNTESGEWIVGCMMDLYHEDPDLYEYR